MGKIVKLIESGDGETTRYLYTRNTVNRPTNLLLYPMKTAPVNDELNSGSLPLVLYHTNKFNKKYNCNGPQHLNVKEYGISQTRNYEHSQNQLNS